MALLGAIPVQAQIGASAGENPFGPDIAFPFCIDFVNFVDGLDISSIQGDKMIVATWQNYDGGGSDAPMLGGFTKGPPRRAFVMADIGTFAPGDMFVFTIEVDFGTLDLWNHDAAGNLFQFVDNEPYAIIPGGCPFRPDSELPTITAAE